MSDTPRPIGPLTGITIIEVPNIGPLQYAGMLLADFGADVIRIERIDHAAAGTNAGGFVSPYMTLDRNRQSIAINLKDPDGIELVKELTAQADVFLEGFRPGVMERLGLGPEVLREVHPELIYGRMTGWGQTGPLSGDVGHDLNYIAMGGALAHIGAPDHLPTIPINLVADFAGGGMMLALGICAALVSRARTGEGQVVDAAMIDGTASLMSVFHGLDQLGAWGPRGTNILDGAAPWYNVYRCSDGLDITVASYEPQFYVNVLAVMGFDDVDPTRQMSAEDWPALHERFRAAFAAETREEWLTRFAGIEACVAPVLTMAESRQHPQHVERETFVEHDGVLHPRPTPRLSVTPGGVWRSPVAAGADTQRILERFGIGTDRQESLRANGSLR
ncbi:MAG: CaiB/BaiF CoA-transferase family protein [Acidimicrobiia bacterium]